MKPILFEELLTKLDRFDLLPERLERENQALRRQLHAQVGPDALVGSGPAMQAVKTLIRKVGPTRSNVLITGESGTGKELVLAGLARPRTRTRRAVRGDQLRRDTRTICSKISSSGTSGARSPGPTATMKGCSSRPVGGRCFLDEVGELPLAHAGEIAAGHREQGSPARRRHPALAHAAARILAADEQGPVGRGRGRADSARICSIASTWSRSRCPRLRDRPEDIPELVSPRC